MGKKKLNGFEYYLSDEIIERYRKKPQELRLEWLYAGNLLRKGYGHDIIKKQEELRKGNVSE
jgi:NADH/NAD ratio-sensing transcriptional regulator Rex